MKFLFVFVLGLVLAEALMTSNSYAEFQANHGKKYSTSKEAQTRAQIWQKNKALIDAHNRDYISGKTTFTMTDNKFADMTPEEVAKNYYGLPPLPKKTNAPTIPLPMGDRQTVPNSLDLTTSPCMPPIKDQNPCGSCWAFAAVNPIEYQNCVKRGKLVLFSEQQLVSCSSSYGNYGCRGGTYEAAWNYTFVAGLANSTAIPYTSVNGLNNTCTYKTTMAAVKLNGWGYLASKGETLLDYFVYTYGPVAVAIQANNYFQLYSGGVYLDFTCSTDLAKANHAVTIVGYGIFSCGGTFWIVRNQWGTNWGIRGYMLMARGVNQCGIGNRPAIPLVA